jgi:hypothetical protein
LARRGSNAAPAQFLNRQERTTVVRNFATSVLNVDRDCFRRTRRAEIKLGVLHDAPTPLTPTYELGISAARTGFARLKAPNSSEDRR